MPRVSVVTDRQLSYTSQSSPENGPVLGCLQKILSTIEQRQEDLQVTRSRLVGSRFRLRM